MSDPPSVAAMWSTYIQTLPDSTDSAARGYSAWHFCDNEQDANELAQLVLAGKKRATCSSLWIYEAENETPPKVGDFSVVTNWQGEAVCVIQTTSVEITPFNQVNESFAAAEGEGDGSLAYWRETHWNFFLRDLAPIGKSPTPEMPLVCERFEVVFS